MSGSGGRPAFRRGRGREFLVEIDVDGIREVPVEIVLLTVRVAEGPAHVEQGRGPAGTQLGGQRRGIDDDGLGQGLGQISGGQATWRSTLLYHPLGPGLQGGVQRRSATKLAGEQNDLTVEVVGL